MNSDAQPTIHPQPGIYRLQAAGLVDPGRPRAGRADLLVRLGPGAGAPALPFERTGAIEVIAAGSPDEIDTHEAAHGAPCVELLDSVLLPGLVNAHTHLDLTHLGPFPHDPDEGFVAWVDRVRAGRAHQPGEIAASVRRGVELSLLGGVTLIGDIAGAPGGRPSLVPFETLADGPLRGVSFLEFFGIGTREAGAIAAIEELLAPVESPLERGGVRVGLQPHAPNTVGIDVYRAASVLAGRLGLPLSTHLAETPEERRFVRDGLGPQRELLERLGAWDDSILETCGLGVPPIRHLSGVLEGTGAIVAHVNDLGDPEERGLEILSSMGVHVAYCPRASAYFGAERHFGPHRYRDMLDAGINVCLGTDSILNLPAGTDDESGPGMSTLEEARFLHRRDGTNPDLLIRMATVNGAGALRADAAGFGLGAGARPLGIVAVDVRDTNPTLDAAKRALSGASSGRFLLKSK